MIKPINQKEKALGLFFIILALSGLGLGLSDGVFANYFKDAYQVDAFQRGIIELPRELPGVLCVFIISGLSFLGDIRLSVISQILSVIGLVILGLFTPSFGIMLFFLFVNSLGMHMFMPLADGIGLSLAQKGSFGSLMGKLNGIRTAFSMLAAILVFVGFRLGFFSFTTPIKTIFLLAAVILTAMLILLIAMQRINGEEIKPGKFRFVFHKEYIFFYLLAILFGARKQIMYVYGPWVLIELLGFKADTMALLAIAGAAVGIFFIPAVGRWIDRFGTARIMMIEAGIFIVIYIAYGLLSAGLNLNTFKAAGLSVVIAFVINMADRMTMQFGMVRSVYMRSIALTPEDVTPTLSFGQALDHVLSILSAVLCGFLWREWGPQTVFIFAALLSAANMTVALRIKKETN